MASIKVRLLSVFCLFAAFSSLAEEFRGRLLYGRHSNFWKEVEALKNSEDPVNQINRFFDEDNYGSREGVVLADLRFLSDSPDFADDLFNQAYIGMGFHGLVGGEAYNRIAPKLRGYALWDVSLDGGLVSSPMRGESGWLGLLATSFGIGRQKLIQGEASDFLDKVATRNSTLFYSGFDLGLGYLSQFSDYMQMRYFVMASPTFFYSQFDDRRYEYGVKKGSRVFRWRTEYESTFYLQPKEEGGLEFGGQLFSGQQPTPVKVVPRTWDSVHNVEAFPVVGSLIGAGLVARVFNASRRVQLETFGGFYGGYFGAGAGFDLYFLRLEAGTFGLEQTSGYRVQESRIEYATVGIHYAW